MRPDSRRAAEGARKVLLGGIAIALVTVVAYGGSFHGQFVSDDGGSVVANDVIRGLDWQHLQAIFTRFDDANYIPIKVLSIAVDYRFWGLDPTGYHLTNLLIHVAGALVVYALLLRMGFAPAIAFLTALVWAVHPVQVESVAWISERKNVLSGLFFFAAFHVYLGFSESGRLGSYVGLLLLYVLALLSKMNTMVLPAICLAYELTYRFRLRRRDVLAAIPMLVLAGVVGWINLAGNPIHGQSWHGGSRVVTWLTSAVVFFRYFQLMLLPIDLTPFYQVQAHETADAAVLLAGFGFVLITAVTVTLILRRRQEAFWILWFGICLAPMLNIIVPFRSLMQDRFLYLPLLGPIALIASVLDAALRAPRMRRVAAVAAAAVALGCARLSYRQVEVWASPLAQWKSMAVVFRHTPADPVSVDPDFDAKTDVLREEATRRPSSAAVRNNLGALYFSAGRMLEAEQAFAAAAEIAPEDPIILTNLGRAHAWRGDLEHARRELERAVAASPYSVLARLNLARVYLAQGDAPDARAQLEACARIVPEPGAADAWRNERAQLERLEAQNRAPSESR